VLTQARRLSPKAAGLTHRQNEGDEHVSGAEIIPTTRGMPTSFGSVAAADRLCERPATIIDCIEPLGIDSDDEPTDVDCTEIRPASSDW
jgi:hypothetical protein